MFRLHIEENKTIDYLNIGCGDDANGGIFLPLNTGLVGAFEFPDVSLVSFFKHAAPAAYHIC